MKTVDKGQFIIHSGISSQSISNFSFYPNPISHSVARRGPNATCTCGLTQWMWHSRQTLSLENPNRLKMDMKSASPFSREQGSIIVITLDLKPACLYFTVLSLSSEAIKKSTQDFSLYSIFEKIVQDQWHQSNPRNPVDIACYRGSTCRDFMWLLLGHGFLLTCTVSGYKECCEGCFINGRPVFSLRVPKTNV